MSIKQVNAFYELLISDPAIYQEYRQQCCQRGFLGSHHWDKTKIVNFAATLGYKFNEFELNYAWLEGESEVYERGLNLSECGQLS